MKYGLCKFPECAGFDKGGKYGLCRKHEEMMKFFIWMLENIKVQDEQKTKSGLILPK
jgi:hypothetical protein